MEIQCSRCGATTSFAYSAGNVIKTARAGWNSYGAALYCPECSSTWDKRNKGRPLAGHENTIDVIDGMHAQQRRDGIDRDDEFVDMEYFVIQNSFDQELYREQLRALWTAYCLRHDLNVDTSEYDTNLTQIWNIVSEDEEDTADWSDFDSFDRFMCRYLV